jgi:hypothetical protein
MHLSTTTYPEPSIDNNSAIERQRNIRSHGRSLLRLRAQRVGKGAGPSTNRNRTHRNPRRQTNVPSKVQPKESLRYMCDHVQRGSLCECEDGAQCSAQAGLGPRTR